MFQRMYRSIFPEKKPFGLPNRTCSRCKNPYFITNMEFTFYRLQDIPTPTVCRPCQQRERELSDVPAPRVMNS